MKAEQTELYRNTKIKTQMTALNKTVNVLADEARVDVNTITRLRQGKDVKVSNFKKVLKCLKLTSVDMFADEPVEATGSN